MPTEPTSLRGIQCPRRYCSLAGFQVIISGRFWVIAEVLLTQRLLCPTRRAGGPKSPMFPPSHIKRRGSEKLHVTTIAASEESNRFDVNNVSFSGAKLIMGTVTDPDRCSGGRCYIVGRRRIKSDA